MRNTFFRIGDVLTPMFPLQITHFVNYSETADAMNGYVRNIVLRALSGTMMTVTRKGQAGIGVIADNAGDNNTPPPGVPMTWEKF